MVFGKSKDIIGLDFSQDELMISHLRQSGKSREFENLIHYTISGASEDEIAQMIVKALSDFKIKNPLVVNVVPLHLAITKNLEIPSLDTAEIREIIDLQSGRQTPYSREEIIVDYINIGTYRQSYTKILLVIVTRAAIKRQFDIMQKAGLRIEKIVFAPEGIAHACFNEVKKELQSTPVGIVHIDTNFTDFIIALKGMPIFTRSIPIGMKHFQSEKDKSSEKFIEELKSSIETYQSEDIDKSPQMLYLSGASESIEELEALLTDKVHIPIKTIPYFTILPLNEKLASVPAITRNVSFFNITSVLLNPAVVTVSLMPEEVKLKRAFEARAHELVKMSIYIIFILIFFGSFFLSKLYFKGMYLKKLRLQNQTTMEEAQILEKAMERIRIVKHYLRNRGQSLEVISALFDILPKNIMLSDVKLDAQNNLYLKGTGRAMSNVFSFVSALEDSESFSNVKTNYTTSRKQEDEDWADFGISCILVKN